MRKNQGEWGSIENLGMDGWEIVEFSLVLRSWVKYGENMEGVRNVGEEWGSVLGYGGGVEDVGRSEEVFMG